MSQRAKLFTGNNIQHVRLYVYLYRAMLEALTTSVQRVVLPKKVFFFFFFQF